MIKLRWKKLNQVGKNLYSKIQCSAVVLLRYSTSSGDYEHIMITGRVNYDRKANRYKIYCYAHTGKRDGNSTKYSSLDEFFTAKNKWNQSINVYYLTWYVEVDYEKSYYYCVLRNSFGIDAYGLFKQYSRGEVFKWIW